MAPWALHIFLLGLVWVLYIIRVCLFSLKFLFLLSLKGFLTFIHCSLLVEISLAGDFEINRKKEQAIILKINTNENVSFIVCMCICKTNNTNYKYWLLKSWGYQG